MIVLIILWSLVALCILIYTFLRWNFNYWWYYDVDGPKPEIIFGNLPSAITKKRHVMYDIWDIYENYKNTNDFVGIFKNRIPELLVLSPQLARKIYVTDFKHFHDNASMRKVTDKIDFLFANNPFEATGEKWKQRRSEITPGITAGRIKAMFPITMEICKRMSSYIEAEIKVPANEGIDAKDLGSRFMADNLADCIMGLQSDSFNDFKNAPLLANQDQMFKDTPFYNILTGIFPFIRNLFKVRFITKQYESYFVGLMKKAIEIRKSLSAQEERSDFLNYMLHLQEEKGVNVMEMSAHSMTFLLDGFETVSSVLAHTLLMVARHPEIQQKLRQEIVENLGSNKDFDIIHDMPYLNACIHESLRLFPVTFLARKTCTEPIVWVDKNGKSFKVREGMTIIVPHYAIMMDDQVYEEPMEFRPERFLEANGGVKKYFDMGAYWGYGDGPRICLGIRFGLMQIKAALVEILTKFSIKPNAKTRTDYKFDANYFLARLDGGIYLDFELLQT